MNSKVLQKISYSVFCVTVVVSFLYSLAFMTDVTGSIMENFNKMGVEKINDYNKFIFNCSIYSLILSFSLIIFQINKGKMNIIKLIVILIACLYNIVSSIICIIKLPSVITIYSSLDFASFNKIMTMYGVPEYIPTTRFMSPGIGVYCAEILFSIVLITISVINVKKDANNREIGNEKTR